MRIITEAVQETLQEMDCGGAMGGATSAGDAADGGSSGPFVQPLFGKVVRRPLYNDYRKNKKKK